MIARQCADGHILAITSDAGRGTFPKLSIYSGTKFFGEAYLKTVRQEVVGKKIKITSIQPGDVNTPLQDASLEVILMLFFYFAVNKFH